MQTGLQELRLSYQRHLHMVKANAAQTQGCLLFGWIPLDQLLHNTPIAEIYKPSTLTDERVQLMRGIAARDLKHLEVMISHRLI